MGGSSTKQHHGGRPESAAKAMTTNQLLVVLSERTSVLKETFTNMQKSPMSDSVARPYLADILKTAKKELETLIPYSPDPDIGRTHGRTGQERQNQSQSRHGTESDSMHHQLDKSRTEMVGLRSQIDQFVDENKTNLQTIDDLSKQIETLKTELQQLRTEKQKLQKDIQNSKLENRELLHRLSKLTGDKLTLDNPNITDLSDPNRPTKLVEMMAELYNNEWTDAFEALQTCKKTPDNTAVEDKILVKILLDTFMDIFSFCKGKSTGLVSIAEKTVNHVFEDFNTTVKAKNRMTKSKSTTVFVTSKGKASLGRENSLENSNLVFMDWKDDAKEINLEDSGAFSNVEDVGDVWPKLEGELKKLRKEFGIALIPMVTKAYLKPRWTKACVPAMKPYIKKCVNVAWLMCIQTPPMSVASLPQHGEDFDSNVYSPYQTRSTAIDYVVWPAVILTEPKTATEKPAVINKGVAEGKLK